jgi:hypothetical protein
MGFVRLQFQLPGYFIGNQQIWSVIVTSHALSEFDVAVGYWQFVHAEWVVSLYQEQR